MYTYCPDCEPDYRPDRGPVRSLAWCPDHAPEPARAARLQCQGCGAAVLHRLPPSFDLEPVITGCPRCSVSGAVETERTLTETQIARACLSPDRIAFNRDGGFLVDGPDGDLLTVRYHHARGVRSVQVRSGSALARKLRECEANGWPYTVSR